jgi:hypothetical protein
VADGLKINIKGIRELQRALKTADSNLPKQLRVALNKASNEVIDYAQGVMPRKTGRAVGSLKARSSQREARVGLGGKRAPHAPWLDFGGQGRVAGRPAPRPFRKEGRYVYRGLELRRDRITEIMNDGLHELAREAGLEMT